MSTLTDERIRELVDHYTLGGELRSLSPYEYTMFVREIEAEVAAPLLARIAELETQLKYASMAAQAEAHHADDLEAENTQLKERLAGREFE